MSDERPTVNTRHLPLWRLAIPAGARAADQPAARGARCRVRVVAERSARMEAVGQARDGG
jgi:hypothetical protein